MKTSNIHPMRYVAVLLIVSILGAGPIIFNLVVDPFNMNELFDFDLDKREISVKAHYPLYKMIEYPRKRGAHVVLGDSRSRALQDKYFKETGFSGAYNFAYGGATVPEIYSTYEYLRDNADIKTLIVGVPLRTFDLKHRGGLNRVPEAIELADAPLRYYSSWFVAKTGWANIDDRYGKTLDKLARLVPSLVGKAEAEERGGAVNLGPLQQLMDESLCKECRLPEIAATRELSSDLERYGLGLGPWATVWKEDKIDRRLPKKFARQVSKNASNDWRRFSFSDELWDKIAEIADWCDREGINLVFFVPPTIVEMQHRITDFGLADVNHTFRARLAQFAPVVDFDFDSPLTRDLDNFKDAYHFDSGVARAIVGEVARLISTPDHRGELSPPRSELVHCPIDNNDKATVYTHGRLTLRAGVNCRIWSVSDV
ncbi:MAG TPA: hypothetical protein DDW48_10050 [Methyloceanibacter sp.]|nr:hypothetical protein [Methyloceanibacter sp.]